VKKGDVFVNNVGTLNFIDTLLTGPGRMGKEDKGRIMG
jgi:hypothetical protein